MTVPGPTAIIGGGYAGMAAAVSLAQAGVPVTVFEAAKQLGGRARATATDLGVLDNGQHILLGAYRETLRLIDIVGENLSAEGRLYTRRRLELHIAGQLKLKAWCLPAPWHLAAGLATARGLSVGERLQAIRFLQTMKDRNFQLEEDQPVTALLERNCPAPALHRLLWEPLCVAALNTPADQASARIFLHVLRDSLGGPQPWSDLILPLVDLGRLFPAPAAEFVRRRGGVVQLSTPIRAVETIPGGYRVHTPGSSSEFSHIVCAVPPSRLASIARHLPGLGEAIGKASSLAYQPIYTVYLQYPETIRLPRPMTGMLGGLTQWLFDRGQLGGQKGLMAAVISARGPHESFSLDQLALAVHREILPLLPNQPPLRRHKVIAEKRATFSCEVGIHRPSQRTALPGFYLAGDYTASEYPATLEAAVESGVKCANLLLETAND